MLCKFLLLVASAANILIISGIAYKTCAKNGFLVIGFREILFQELFFRGNAGRASVLDLWGNPCMGQGVRQFLCFDLLFVFLRFSFLE